MNAAIARKLPKPKKRIVFVPSLAKQEMNGLIAKLIQSPTIGIDDAETAQGYIRYVLEQVVELLENPRELRNRIMLRDHYSRFLPMPLIPLLKEYTQERMKAEERVAAKMRVEEALDPYLLLAEFASLGPLVRSDRIFEVQERYHHPELEHVGDYEGVGYGW